MATVITNLLSAIPIFGQDIVESNFFLILQDNYYLLKCDTLNSLVAIGIVNVKGLKKVIILKG